MGSTGFKRVYPPTGKLVFDGGMNSKFGRSLIADSETPDALNVTVAEGTVGTRNGYTVVNTAPVGTYVCDGLYVRHTTNNSETMVAFFGGSPYTLAGTSFTTIGSGQSLYTMGVRVYSSEMENHIFFGNGSQIGYKWNGTDWTRHGVYPPTSMTASIASGAGGALSGAYQYKMTYVNTQAVEGNPSSDGTATFVVTAKMMSITSLPVAPQSWGVGSRRLYRTVTSGTTFFRVATISDNTTTTYTDNIADSALGGTIPTNNGVPPIYTAIIYHKNRLFMIGNDNLVWYTELNEPFTVGLLNFDTFGDQSVDIPITLNVYNDTVVIKCRRSVWLWYMPDTNPANWQKIRVQTSFSSTSPFGAFDFGNFHFYPAVQNGKFVGFTMLNGASVAESSTILTIGGLVSQLQTMRIDPDMLDVQDAYAGNISSVVFKNQALVTLTKGAGQTTNNRVYFVAFPVESISDRGTDLAWIPWDGIQAAQFAIYNNTIYFGSANAVGFVYKFDSSVYSDNGGAINSYFWTKEFSGLQGEDSYSKDFRYANLMIDLAGSYSMNLAVRTDSDSGMGTNYAVDLSSSASVWGSMRWGLDDWGAGDLQEDTRVFLGGARGKRLQLKFSNQNVAGQRFKVHFANFTYNMKGPR